MIFGSITAEPPELKRLGSAFDAAWLACAERIDPLDQAAARERLAYLIVQIWQLDRSADLSAMAVKLFREGAAHAAMTPAGAKNPKIFDDL